MRGMDAQSGKPLTDTAHLVQSVGDILTTPVGSRVMRRDYGSLLPRLIDQPFNAATRIRLVAAIATALMRWEPRLQITRVTVGLGPTPGVVVVTLDGTRTDTPTSVADRFTVPLSLP